MPKALEVSVELSKTSAMRRLIENIKILENGYCIYIAFHIGLSNNEAMV